MSDIHINPLELRKMHKDFFNNLPSVLFKYSKMVCDGIISNRDFLDLSQAIMSAYMILYTRYINSERKLTEESRK
jgi:hypothetical protein